MDITLSDVFLNVPGASVTQNPNAATRGDLLQASAIYQGFEIKEVEHNPGSEGFLHFP